LSCLTSLTIPDFVKALQQIIKEPLTASGINLAARPAKSRKDKAK
jgi:hypothetical protein